MFMNHDSLWKQLQNIKIFLLSHCIFQRAVYWFTKTWSVYWNTCNSSNSATCKYSKV